MSSKLILVDLESVQRIDLSMLDESYRAIVFVGAKQEPPKAARRPATAHRFRRVDFQKVDGSGPNALDFYIAFHLGRMFETDRAAECCVLSRDKGFDPLLVHLNRNGLKCRRVEDIAELVPELDEAKSAFSTDAACPHCGKKSTIELHGGRWCSNCGRFAVAPDPALLPSNQPGYRSAILERPPATRGQGVLRRVSRLRCACCHQPMEVGDGIYDVGEWMCWSCVAHYAA